MLEPTKADADQLVVCLSRALKSTGIDNLLERECVGCGTDGASVNVSDQSGMWGNLQAVLTLVVLGLVLCSSV